MKTWLILLASAAIAWFVTDVRSDSSLQSLVAPLLLTLVVLIMFIKIMAALLSKNASKSAHHSNDDSAGIGFGSHNDGGSGGGD